MSAEAKHTPGPWKLILHGNETYPFPLSVHTADDSCWIARDGTAAKLADARLMAAAPETTDALRKLVNEVAGLGGFGPEIKALIGVTNWNVLSQRVQEARAAIAKAEGRS